MRKSLVFLIMFAVILLSGCTQPQNISQPIVTTSTCPDCSQQNYQIQILTSELNQYKYRTNIPVGIYNNLNSNGFLLSGTFSNAIYVLPAIMTLRDGSKTFMQLGCTTNSMAPTFNCNNHLIVYVPQNPNEMHVGDIVGFRWVSATIYNSNGISQSFEFIIHRLISQNATDNTFCAQGDNIDYTGYTTQCGITFNDILFKVVGIVY